MTHSSLVELNAQDLSQGQLLEVINEGFELISRDLGQRPNVMGARTLTAKITLVPREDGPVEIAVTTQLALPPKKVMSAIAIRNGNHLMINPLENNAPQTRIEQLPGVMDQVHVSISNHIEPNPTPSIPSPPTL